MRASPYDAELSAGAGLRRPWHAVVADYIALTKPRLSSLVLFTTAGGMWLSGSSLPWERWVLALLGTWGTVGAANSFNCFIERDVDRYMARTALRPLPAQRLGPKKALVFAAVLAVVSLPVVTLATNLLTAALGLLALASYVLVYTPLKSRTHWAMVAGGLPGALPPLMGWTAARGRIELPGVVLFAILFLWQLPHFIAIALFRKEEYRAAGLTSLPLEKGDRLAWWVALGYLLALLPVSLLPAAVGVASWPYLAAAVALGGYFLASAVRGLRRQDIPAARHLFRASLLYLTGLFVALGVDRFVS